MSYPLVKLADVCHIDMGSAPKGTTYVELEKGTPLIAGAADYGDKYPKPKKATNEPTKLSEVGDIIICVRATIGDLNWADKEYCLGRGVAGLRVQEKKLNDLYLWYFVVFYKNKLYQYSTGSTFPQINKKVIESIPIPLPPLEIQKQIADILEQAEQLRKDCGQMEDELNNLAQSVFMDMFGNVKETEKLGEHLEFLTSGSRGWAKYYSNSGSRFLRSLDVQMNFIGDQDVAYVNPPEGREAKRTKTKNGDVLLTITGSRIGRVAWVPDNFGDAHISQHVALIRLRKTLLPEFLSYYLSLPSLGQRQIAKSQYGQTKPGLKLDHIRELRIPKIDICEQRKFVKSMYKLESVVKDNSAYGGQMDDFFSVLMQKAFKGELKL